jgi:hypothetical protein
MSNGPTYGEGATQAPPVNYQPPPPQGYWYWVPHTGVDRSAGGHKKKGRLWIGTLAFLAISLMCLFFSIFLPWYSIEIEWKNEMWNMEHTNVEEHDLYGWECDDEIDMYGSEHSNKTSGTWEDDDERYEETSKVYVATRTLLGVAIAVSLLNLIIMVFAGLKGLGYYLCLSVLIICYIVILLVPIFFAANVPEAIEEDREDETVLFLFKYEGFMANGVEADGTGGRGTVRWGPESGWYLTLLAAQFHFRAMLFFIFVRIGAKSHPGIQQPTQQPFQQPTQQPQPQEYRPY